MTTDHAPKNIPTPNTAAHSEPEDDEAGVVDVTDGTSAEPEDTEADVVDATTIADANAPTFTLALRRRWFNDNEATLVRFLGPKMIAANIHNFVKGVGVSKLTLHCNGGGCVLCMARHKATPTFMIPALFVEDREIGVILVDQNGGPESLRGQLLPLLRLPNLTDLVIEVARKSNRHAAAIICDLSKGAVSGDDYGNEVIRDALARNALKAKAIRASVEQRDNHTLLADLDWIAPKLRLYHPGLDLASL